VTKDLNNFSIGRLGDRPGQPLVSAIPCNLQVPNYSSNTALRFKMTPVETLRATTSLAPGPLTSSPVECFPPPPTPADATCQIRTHRVLQGTITALKLVHQIVGLAPVPGLQSLVGVVLNISEIVNVSFDTTFIMQNNTNTIDPKNTYAVEDALVELARTAGSFMVTLVEQRQVEGSISTFFDSDSDSDMISVIEGLMKFVLTTFM
jgi:hypothetical protein